MRTAQDVIEKLKHEAPEQAACYYDYSNYVSIRDRTWGLILPGWDPENRIGGHFRNCFEESQRIEKAMLCTVEKKRGKYMILSIWGDGKKVTMLKLTTIKKFGFPGCLIYYDPGSKITFFTDKYMQPYALVTPIVDNFENVTFAEDITL